MIVVEGKALIGLQIVVIHTELTGPHPFRILSSRVTVTNVRGQYT